MIEAREGRYWLNGPITIGNAAALRAEGLRQFALKRTDNAQVEVELSQVTDVDSSAVSLLFEWARVLAREGRRIRFHNLTPNMRSLASVYEVLDLLPSH